MDIDEEQAWDTETIHKLDDRFYIVTKTSVECLWFDDETGRFTYIDWYDLPTKSNSLCLIY
jgi:hypothetical protein